MPVGNANDMDTALKRISSERPDAIFASPTGTIVMQRTRVLALAARERIPVIVPFRFMVAEGALLSYSYESSRCCAGLPPSSIESCGVPALPTFRSNNPPISNWSST